MTYRLMAGGPYFYDLAICSHQVTPRSTSIVRVYLALVETSRVECFFLPLIVRGLSIFLLGRRVLDVGSEHQVMKTRWLFHVG